jgi:hypothetical protein
MNNKLKNVCKESHGPVWVSTYNLSGEGVEYRKNIIRGNNFVDRDFNMVLPELKKKRHFLKKISRNTQRICSGIRKNDPRNVTENNNLQTILTTIQDYDGR